MGWCFPSLSHPQLSPMYFFLLLKNIGTLNTHTIRRIATSCIWSAKGRRWLILREVDLEKDTETFLASHYLTVLGEVGNWDLYASDGQIKGYPVQVIPQINCFLPPLKQGFRRYISLKTNLLFTLSPAILIIDNMDQRLTRLKNGIN